jgi:hypothetical protein
MISKTLRLLLIIRRIISRGAQSPTVGGNPLLDNDHYNKNRVNN